MRSIDETIPEPTDDLVSRCLQPNPNDRFEKTTDLAGALDRLDDKGELRPIRRVVGLPMVAAAILLLLIVAGGAWWYAVTSIPPVEHEPVSVLIADFQNSTQDSAFNSILEQALGSAVEGASFVSAYNRNTARRIAGELKAGEKLDENAARVVSTREGIKVILTGSIEPKGSGYAITVNAIDPANGNALGTGSASAASKDEVLKAIERVAVRIRTVLGDAKPESERLAAAETVSASSLEAVQNYQQGQSLAMVGKHEEARDAYLRAIAIDPGFGRAYAALAAAYYHLKDEPKMKAAFDEALKRSDRMTEREKYRTLGNYYLAVARNYEKAVENYESLLKLFPADDSGHGNLGLAYMLLGKLDMAAAEAREALKIYPRNYLQRYNLSQYLMFSGNFDESITEGSKVIEEAPTYTIAYLPVALAALSKGDTATALGTYDRLDASGEVGAGLARIGRADFEMYRGRYREALKIVGPVTTPSKAATAAPQDFVAVAEIALALGQKKQAIDAALKAVSLTDNESVSFPAALVLIEAGRSADAQKVAETLENTLQVQTTAYAKLIAAQSAAKDGRLGAAVEAFQESLKRRDSWFLHYLRGKLYAETKHFPEALGDLEEALKRKGEVTDIFASDTATMRYLPPLYYWLARTQQELGDTTGARKNYQQYISLRTEADPADPLVADSKTRLSSLPQ